MTAKNGAEQCDCSDSGSPSPQLHTDVARVGIVRTILRFRWLLIYLATVAAVVWWYEYRPARQALQRIQGTWREVEGVIPDERVGDTYFHVHGNETWFVYPFDSKWSVQRSRIMVRPAENVFIVRRAFGFDYGNTRETEYILYLKNGELYILRGLARLDTVRENTVEKLRSVNSLPNDAKDSIQEYNEKSAKQSQRVAGDKRSDTSGKD